MAMKITYTLPIFVRVWSRTEFSKNEIIDLIKIYQTILFYNLVIVFGGEELLYSLTHLESCWASS